MKKKLVSLLLACAQRCPDAAMRTQPHLQKQKQPAPTAERPAQNPQTILPEPKGRKISLPCAATKHPPRTKSKRLIPH